jgi:branched-chain amino acid transport system permease protein
MATLGVAEMLRIIASNWISVTAGPRGLIVKHTAVFPGLNYFSYQIQVFLISVVVAAICYFSIRALVNSHTGKILMSIRDNEPLANSVGINPTLYKTFSFTVGGAVTALAGGLYALNYGIVIPDLLSMQYTTIGLLIVLIGGQGEIWGPLAGSVIYMGFNEGLRSLGNLRMVLFAIILIIVVLLFPRGLVGTIKGWHRTRTMELNNKTIQPSKAKSE